MAHASSHRERPGAEARRIAQLRALYPVWQRHDEYFTASTSGGIANTTDYGDWCSVPTCNAADILITKPEHGTAFYYMLLNALQRAATLLGRSADAQTYRGRADQVRTAFNAQFFDPTINIYHEANQPAGTYKQYPNVIALAAELVPADRVDAVTANLENDLRLRGNHVDLGIIGVRYLFDLLTRTGRVQTAYDVATQTTYPPTVTGSRHSVSPPSPRIGQACSGGRASTCSAVS